MIFQVFYGAIKINLSLYNVETINKKPGLTSHLMWKRKIKSGKKILMLSSVMVKLPEGHWQILWVFYREAKPWWESN